MRRASRFRKGRPVTLSWRGACQPLDAHTDVLLRIFPERQIKTCLMRLPMGSHCLALDDASEAGN